MVAASAPTSARMIRFCRRAACMTSEMSFVHDDVVVTALRRPEARPASRQDAHAGVRRNHSGEMALCYSPEAMGPRLVTVADTVGK